MSYYKFSEPGNPTEWIGPEDGDGNATVSTAQIPDAVRKLKCFNNGQFFSRWRGPTGDRMYVLYKFGSGDPLYVWAEQHNQWFVNNIVTGDLKLRSVTLLDQVLKLPATCMHVKDLRLLTRLGLFEFLVHKTGEKP